MEYNKGENKNLPRQSGPWWKPAFEIFSEISTYIAVPIICALIAGKALDKHYGTAPILLLVMVALSFLVTSFGIIKAVKKYSAKIKKDTNNLK
jgi:predicted permease